MNIKDKIKKIAEQKIPVVTGGSNSGYSVSIVNSEGNGKRIAISKALTSELSLADTLYVVPNPNDDEFLVSSNPIANVSSSGKLSGTDKKICYSASLVSLLVDNLMLDYTEKTSLAFSDVSFDDFDGQKIAIVKVESSKCLKESSDEEA